VNDQIVVLLVKLLAVPRTFCVNKIYKSFHGLLKNFVLCSLFLIFRRVASKALASQWWKKSYDVVKLLLCYPSDVKRNLDLFVTKLG